MIKDYIELLPKYDLNKNWEINKPISLECFGDESDEEELKIWIASTRIEVAGSAETIKLDSDKKYEYLKSEIGMNIVVPKGRIEQMRFKVSLKGDGKISGEVIAMDGFPKDVIEEKEIMSGKIKIRVDKFFKFVPVVGDVISNSMEIELNTWEFKLGSLRKVNVDFSGGLTFQPEWYFKENGIKNDLRVALTIKKLKSIKTVEGEVVAAWYYNPGFLHKIRVGTDGKTVKIY